LVNAKLEGGNRVSSLFQPRAFFAVNHSSQEHFLAACGSSEPLRIGVGLSNAMSLDTRTFQQPFLVIGRRLESDLVLDDWQVSRRHAYLQLLEGRYYCVDLGSRTGTHGGDATERSGWLQYGRAIHIGSYTVRPEWPARSNEASGPSPGLTWEVPGRAVGQPVGQTSWRMDQQLILIGRSPACKIRILEPDVSMFHCSIVLTPRGAWVVDLLGQKGVFVNDEPIRCARLEDGDLLRVGRHTLRARYDTPPLPLPRPRTTSPSSTANQASLVTVVPPNQFLATNPIGEFPSRLMPSQNQDMTGYLANSGAVVDPSVNLLVQQFAMMQQQMFDQFHQTMMMMFEGFAALHREQASSIREEFEEVRKLSQEIEALRIETARLAESATTKVVEPPKPVTKVVEAPRPAIKVVEPPKPVTNGHPLPGRQPPTIEAKNPPAPSEPIKRAAPPPPDPNVDIHAQLCLRLSKIQTERQTRWQKILGMMSSRS
jgi:pSer/pThr/pTyr-binding forkhead associated (FHA) protein